ncbi:MAG: Gmad2 immunoglobulin-like domain-containing protein [Candidatus Paceibacterota bacterium]
MKRLLVVAVLILIAIAGAWYGSSNLNTGSNSTDPDDNGNGDQVTEKDDLIRVTSPVPNAVVSSPLTVAGEARGNWYFEADFPVRILDANGNELGVVPAQAQGDWMTAEYVPFSAELTFSTPSTDTGTVVFERSNPSGLPENANELRVPIRFNANATPQRSVSLYYYNPERDQDASGNILCSDAGLVEVTRQIPVTQTPIQDTIRLLLEGNLTAQEEAQGIETEYPLTGFALTGANLANGTLTLSFNDSNNRTSGGSCRVGILWAQIRETALQFDVVDEVEFTPETLFQP